jgi:hypothetical protein
MEWSPVPANEVGILLRAMLNWKVPGRDPIQNFWLKQLTATHKHLATLFNKVIEEDATPEWLMAGVTLLNPRNKKLENQRTTDP